MKKLNQKGVAATFVILILILLLAIGGVGYYVWKQKNESKPAGDTTLSQPRESSKKEEPAQNQPAGSYTIDLSGSKNPQKKEVAYSEFSLTNVAGRKIVYDTTQKKFVHMEFDGSGKKDATPNTTAADSTPIYLWENGDAGSYTDTYLIDLKNGNVLQVVFGYCNYDDGINKCPGYMTASEIKTQRAKDMAAVKTFKFTQ